MAPTTKKSTIRATARALNPSSFLIPTEECWDDIMLLFLIRSPSSSYSRTKMAVIKVGTKATFKKSRGKRVWLQVMTLKVKEKESGYQFVRKK